MSGFRSHDGQHSDRMPIKRTVEEKRRMLAQLKEQQAGMKAWAAAGLKESLAKRILELEQDLARGPAKAAAQPRSASPSAGAPARGALPRKGRD